MLDICHILVLAKLFKNTNMFTCLTFKVFLLSETSFPALTNIHSGGIDVPGIEIFLAGLDIQGTGTGTSTQCEHYYSENRQKTY